MNTAKEGDLGPWLALFYARSFSLTQKHQLLERWGSPAALRSVSAQEFAHCGLSPAQIKALDNCWQDASNHWPGVQRALDWQTEPSCHVVTFDSSAYPRILKETACPPLLLFVCGDPLLLNTQQLAIVGSRNASHAGLDIARQFARDLARAKLTITSGLALGIDAQAHRGALEGSGNTIAVLGSGVNCLYPKRNRSLGEEIIERGALVSEFPLGAPPRPEHFPRRNRIISGMSIGTLVVEAAMKSGSLISANYAANQSREVFAIPGSIRNPLSQGCHWLIQQGAALVQSPQEILDQLALQLEVPINTSSAEQSPVSALDTTGQQVIAATDYEVTELETLLKRTGLSVEELSARLIFLELNGFVRSIAGGYERVR